MDVRNEMKRTMKAFGKPLKIISSNEQTSGAGIFQKISKKSIKNKNDIVSSVGYIAENKYSLWLFDYTPVNKIDKVICENKAYSILSGDYDPEIGCWRLIVREEQHEII